ncbi:hypothetical protein PIB30_115024, partial [Stylosanthes scabra]|nr:hypothetical protein [Stylosanthes scabra]
VTDQNLDECPRVFPLEESPVARTLLRTLGSHPLVIPRAGYRHKEKIDERRKIGDFPGYLCLLNSAASTVISRLERHRGHPHEDISADEADS